MRPMVLIFGRWRWAGLLLALGAASALARPPAPLRLTVEPAQMVLGLDPRAQLTIEGPAELAAVQLSSNLGAIEAVQRTGPGRFQAVFRPPSKRFPMVAILAAWGRVGEELLLGWTAVPLFGQGDATLKTRPRAQVEVRIGERLFGPVEADDKGLAKVPVVVPPGERAFDGTREIDLGLPATPHLHLVAPDGEIAAAVDSAVELWALVVDEKGRPRGAAELELIPSEGQAEATEVAPGLQSIAWKLPPGPAGQVLMKVRLPGDAPSDGAIQVTRREGLPSSASILMRAPSLVAGQELEIRVEVLDGAGNPSGEPVELVASAGELVDVQAESRGRMQARLRHAPTFFGRREIEVTASYGHKVLARIPVPLAAAAPEEIALQPERQKLLADGQGRASFRATVTDRFGNPVAEPRLAASADAGTVQLEATGEGEYRLEYRADRLRGTGVATLRADAGDASATAQIELVPTVSRLSLAAKAGGLLGGGTASFHGAGEASLGFLLGGETLAAGLEAAWFQLHRAESTSSGAVDGRHDFLTLSAGLRWLRDLSPTLTVWTGADAVGALVNSHLQLGDQPPQVERSLTWGAELRAGISARMALGGPLLEVRLLRLWAPRMSGSLQGRLTAVALDVGYRFEAF